ncbi:MAG: hypothetical protein ACFFDF_19360, partial [Candidatus Odinarchaeota archaeon]
PKLSSVIALYNAEKEIDLCLKSIFKEQTTYFIINLKLSKLFNDILREAEKGKIPLLETRLLLHTLIDTPFLKKDKGTQILKDVTNCIENHWYSIEDTWNYKVILKQLKTLQKLIVSEFLIYGSFTIYNDDYIEWNTTSSLFVNREKINKIISYPKEF